MWKILDTKTIFEHPRITLEEDTLHLPDGTQTKYLKFAHAGDGADAIAIREDGKILLQQEYNHPVGKKLWQFPGGFIDEGENPELAAKRELLEETGYQGKKTRSIGFHYIYRRRIAEKSHVFIVTELTQEQTNREATEFGMTQSWFTPAQIDSMIKNGEITAGDTLAIWMLYKATLT